MCKNKILLMLLLGFSCYRANAQDNADSALQNLQAVPVKYYKQVEEKIDRYSNRVTGKTEKTLTRMAQWETKIHDLLQKANPAVADRLFAPGQPTFSSLLQNLKEGKALAENYKASYDAYRDHLVTGLKYAAQEKEKLGSKYIAPIRSVANKINSLEQDVADAEAVEKFIKERKKQLIEESVKYIGKSKYLSKINKESYYYIEAMHNYKEIFSDPKKTEETAKNILDKIPAFQKFMQKNGAMAFLFNVPAGYGTSQALAGLQTRAGVNSQIQSAIASAGPNAQAMISQQLQAGQAELDKLKQKVLASGGGSSDKQLPDFKPNEQKTKTFLQRIQYGANIQFAKNNTLLPATADIAGTIGYKLNDKSTVGVGVAYKLGMGSIQHIRISHQGLGLRSFADWKLKKHFFVTGGFEMNYNQEFTKASDLKEYASWQRAGLIGLTKKINIKTKISKGTQVQLLYDILFREHIPATQPVLFRLGYNF